MTRGSPFSAERYLQQARRWADRAARYKRPWLGEPFMQLAWGYLKLARDAVERMKEPG